MICVDTSFLASYYLSDRHSEETDRRMLGLPAIHVSLLNRTELAQVLGQYQFRKAITLADSRMAWSDFEEDCRNGLWVQAAWCECRASSG